MQVRLSSKPALTRADADTIRLIARTPLGQRVTARRLLIRALRRRGFTRQDIRQFLRLSHSQLVSEEAPGA